MGSDKEGYCAADASETGGEERWQKTKTHPGTTSRGQGASCAKEIISLTSAVSWRWD